jgi:steroid delta-isomerase
MNETHSTQSVVEAYFAAVGSADREAFVALFSADVHFEDPLGAGVLLGHEGVARFHKGLGRAWASLRMAPTALHVRGERAAVAWHAQGHSTSGKDIQFDGIDTFDVDEDGLIRRVEGYWDMEGVIAQM